MSMASVSSASNDAYTTYFTPALKYVFDSLFMCCYCGRDRPRGRSMTPRSGIYFDMYEEDEFGREELERLLQEEEQLEFAQGLDFDQDVDDGPGLDASGGGATEPGAAGSSTSGLPFSLPLASTSHSVKLRQAPPEKIGRRVQNYLAQFLPSFFEPKLRYRPSAAGLQVRERSSTKSSIESSDTFRSRTELLSDGDHEDAQLVGDINAALVNYAAADSSDDEHRSSS